MASRIPHVLIDRNGLPLRAAAFAPGVVWKRGDVVFFGPSEQSYVVVERRDGEPVELVVDRA